jgi:hypothetical protein
MIEMNIFKKIKNYDRTEHISEFQKWGDSHPEIIFKITHVK